MNAKAFLLEKIQDGSLANLTLEEICKELALAPREKPFVKKILDELVKTNDLFVDGAGRYGTAETLGGVKGKLQGNERGFAFLIPDSGGEDYFIPNRLLHGAMHADTVLCLPVPGGKGDEAEVVQILERGMKEIVGTVFRDRGYSYLRPDERRYFCDVYLPGKKSTLPPIGTKAVAKILDYPPRQCPVGEIVEVLSAENELFLEELSLIRAHGLKEEFPEEVKRQAKKVSSRPVEEKDLLGRKDLREELIFTIDGADTRDVDDAISVKKEGETYLLGVHIADVSEYVAYQSALDSEALSRGTSVYFPDRVLPMLPKELSNGICSLNEGEDRLALSCIMRVDKTGKVIEEEIVKSVVRSRHKMTYDKVDEILAGDLTAREEYSDLLETLTYAEELTNILTQMRRKKGYIALDVKELSIYLTPEGKIEIPEQKESFSRGLIEQFMVLANETVAEWANHLSLPFVYRVHEKPDEEKAKEFQLFLTSLNLPARFRPESVRPNDYKTILERLEGDERFSLVNRVMLRSMQKAKYSPVNAGHFGLSSSCYCHFTSPIRRYPDLCIHRIIKEVLDGKYAFAREKYSAFVKEAASNSSAAEKTAQETERQVDDLYALFYLKERIGEEFPAVISGVTAFGLFAELKNGAEGFIPLETLPPDEYEYLDGQFRLQGRKRAYTIGQSVRIFIAGCDFDRMRAEFCLLEEKKRAK